MSGMNVSHFCVGQGMQLPPSGAKFGAQSMQPTLVRPFAHRPAALHQSLLVHGVHWHAEQSSKWQPAPVAHLGHVLNAPFGQAASDPA
jgi:hypothetical protein